MKRFNLAVIRPGDVLHVRRYGSKVSWLIRKALGSWGNHDALFVTHPDTGKLYLGDCVSPVAKLTALEDFEAEATAGIIEMRVYRPTLAKLVDGAMYWPVEQRHGMAAAKWWVENIRNSPYAWAGFIYLIFLCLKLRPFAWVKKLADIRWDHWCSEGVGTSYREGAGIDVYDNDKPTPLTTEKRVASGKWADITATAVVEV
jgi:hypothetical protein